MDIDMSALRALVRDRELSFDLIAETLEQAVEASRRTSAPVATLDGDGRALAALSGRETAS